MKNIISKSASYLKQAAARMKESMKLMYKRLRGKENYMERANRLKQYRSFGFME